MVSGAASPTIACTPGDLARIVERMSEGVCLMRADDGTIVYANPKFERTLAYGPGELLGQPAHTLLYAASPEDALAQCDAMRAQTAALGEATFELDNLRKDGLRIICRATATRMHHDVHGDVVIVVQQDVTEQRRTLEERDGFFENALDMLCITDLDGRFRRLNPAWAEVLGWSTDELLGRTLLELVHPEDRERTAAELARLAADHATLAFESRALAIDGSYRVLAWRSASSRPLGLIFACARDITELRRTEQALRDAGAEKDTLLKEIHHRVKNNLQVISSLLKLRAETLTSAEARHALQDSQERVRSIALLHEKLYRSTELGSIELGEYAQGLFATLLRTYRLEPAPQLAVTGGALRLGIDAAVPVGLILSELMTNSLKHAFAGSPRPPRMEVALHEADGIITIVFADNGVGYPPGVDDRPPSTLGLELVHTLASQVGGAITQATSAGARCTLRFPRDLDGEA